MAQIAETTTIARSPEQVWAVLADFGSIAEWAPNVDHSCLTTELQQAVGSTRRVQVGRNALLEQVVEWEAGHRLAYTIEGLPPVIRSVTNSWQLEAVGPATAVTITSVVNAGPRPPQQLVARAVGKVLAKASREMLDGLTNHLEEHAA